MLYGQVVLQVVLQVILIFNTDLVRSKQEHDGNNKIINGDVKEASTILGAKKSSYYFNLGNIIPQDYHHTREENNLENRNKLTRNENDAKITNIKTLLSTKKITKHNLNVPSQSVNYNSKNSRRVRGTSAEEVFDFNDVLKSGSKKDEVVLDLSDILNSGSKKDKKGKPKDLVTKKAASVATSKAAPPKNTVTTKIQITTKRPVVTKKQVSTPKITTPPPTQVKVQKPSQAPPPPRETPSAKGPAVQASAPASKPKPSSGVSKTTSLLPSETNQLVTLNGRTYYFCTCNDDKMSWMASLNMCAAFGMNLVTIDTEAENLMIAKYLQDIQSEEEGYHIGGHKIGRTYFRWLSGRLLEFEAWEKKVLENFETNHCMAMTNGMWNPVQCHTQLFYFICEQRE